MKRTDLNKEHKNRAKAFVTAVGMIVILYYVIMSIRNLIQIIMNFSLISANGSMASIVLNILLYLFMIVAGFTSVARSKNPYYIIFTLITILIIY